MSNKSLNRHKLKFKPGAVDKLAKDFDITLGILASELGIGYAHLYRTTLQPGDKYFSYVGADIVAGLMARFPGIDLGEYIEVVKI